ncbi:MAG: MFS transporter [Candidatus Caldarchaeum sp.]|nr:MFS transporter [Candidatus Caldarchaeum sp.]
MKKNLAVLVLTWISWFWSHGSRVGVSAVTPFLRQKYAMSTAEAAVVPGALNLGFYLFAFVAGRVPGRIGFKNTVSIAALGASAMFLTAGLVDSKILLYVLVFMAGVFLSLHLPAAIPWLGSLFKGGRQGFYIGIHESGAPAGQTFGPIILALLFGSVGVAWSFSLWASISLLAGVGVLAVFLSEKSTQKESKENRVSTWVGPGFYGLTLITVANLVGNLGVVAIVPLHLVDTFQLDKALVATLVGISRFVGVFGQPIGGYLHDRYGFFRVATVLTSLNFVTSLYITVAPYNLLYVVAMTVQAFVTAMYFPLIYSYFVKLQGPNAAQHLGKMIFIAGLTGPTTAPIVAGFLAERFSYTVALIYPTALALAGTLQVISMTKKYAKSSPYI